MEDAIASKSPNHQILEKAIHYLQKGGKAPKTAEVVAALAAAEKQSKQQCKKSDQRYEYTQLLGSWRLGFVSGTQKVSPRPGAKAIKKLGNGRFLPRLLHIQITYAPAKDPADGPTWGRVENSVTLGPLALRLAGPTRLWPKTNSLGFDFTEIQAKLGALPFFKGSLRGGAAQNLRFRAQSLKEQAFFTFFIVQPGYIAARGKGGGLALWVKTLD